VIRFDCPACGKRLKVPRESAGCPARCPICISPITTPGVRAEAVPGPPADANIVEYGTDDTPASQSSPQEVDPPSARDAPVRSPLANDRLILRRRRKKGWEVSALGLWIVGILSFLVLIGVVAVVVKNRMNERQETAGPVSRHDQSKRPEGKKTERQAHTETQSPTVDDYQVRTAAVAFGSTITFMIAVGLVSYFKGCSILEAVGWVLLGLLIAVGILFVLVLLLALSGSGRGTQRPQNYCSHCGHTWFPRGHDHSPYCPKCGVRR
jgi:hypothetical protein